jgi:hypothetical protein
MRPVGGSAGRGDRGDRDRSLDWVDAGRGRRSTSNPPVPPPAPLDGIGAQYSFCIVCQKDNEIRQLQKLPFGTAGTATLQTPSHDKHSIIPVERLKDLL